MREGFGKPPSFESSAPEEGLDSDRHETLLKRLGVLELRIAELKKDNKGKEAHWLLKEARATLDTLPESEKDQIEDLLEEIQGLGKEANVIRVELGMDPVRYSI